MRNLVRIVALLGLIVVPMAVASGQQPAAPSPQQTTPPPAPAQNQPQQPTIQRTVELVSLVATVMDRRHKLITDLEKGDFHVLEDGKPQQITFFNRQTDLPLRIGMLLDTSNSIRERLRFEQEAAIDFLYNTLRRGKDLAFLMTFDNEPDVIQDFTGDLSTLTAAIQKQRAGGGTALYDAIYVASERLANAPLAKGTSPAVRRVLVVISDGDDNMGNHALSEALEMAERAETSIYAISTNTDWLSLGGKAPEKYLKSHGDKVLEEFADDTGGRVFFPYKIDDLAQSFQDIGNELRSQYSLGYTPSSVSASGQFRRIRLEVDRKGLVVRTRRGYYASRNSSAPSKPTAPPAGQ